MISLILIASSLAIVAQVGLGFYFAIKFGSEKKRLEESIY